ncbi:hypothetical protein H0N99_01850 [Candidatus Micrarchaeota archaeon]|nr:hypothetical protein [Candidatus Micrarchaeota archaeon]
MIKNIFLLILLFLAAGCTYLPGEQQISLSDFRNELNSSKSIAIVMDTRNAPSQGAVMQCGVNIAGRLGAIGLYDRLSNQTFVYEGEQCNYGTANSSISECESLISNSTVFRIQYNPAKNSTSFYKSKAVMEGDSNFLADCSISKIL